MYDVGGSFTGDMFFLSRWPVREDKLATRRDNNPVAANPRSRVQPDSPAIL